MKKMILAMMLIFGVSVAASALNDSIEFVQNGGGILKVKKTILSSWRWEKLSDRVEFSSQEMSELIGYGHTTIAGKKGFLPGRLFPIVKGKESWQETHYTMKAGTISKGETVNHYSLTKSSYFLTIIWIYLPIMIALVFSLVVDPKKLISLYIWSLPVFLVMLLMAWVSIIGSTIKSGDNFFFLAIATILFVWVFLLPRSYHIFKNWWLNILVYYFLVLPAVIYFLLFRQAIYFRTAWEFAYEYLIFFSIVCSLSFTLCYLKRRLIKRSAT